MKKTNTISKTGGKQLRLTKTLAENENQNTNNKFTKLGRCGRQQ